MLNVDDMRQKLRIAHTAVDSDIKDNMEAARLDMSLAGVDLYADDYLTDKAVELFVKAEFDYMGKGEQFRKNYERLRDSLCVCSEYRRAVQPDV